MGKGGRRGSSKVLRWDFAEDGDVEVESSLGTRDVEDWPRRRRDTKAGAERIIVGLGLTEESTLDREGTARWSESVVPTTRTRMRERQET